MTDAVTPNDIVAFIIEVAAFIGLGIWGWRCGDSAFSRAALIVVIVGVAAVVWGVLVAPTAPVQVPAIEVLLRIVVLGIGLAAFVSMLRPGFSMLIFAVAMVNTVLLYVGPFSR